MGCKISVSTQYNIHAVNIPNECEARNEIPKRLGSAKILENNKYFIT